MKTTMRVAIVTIAIVLTVCAVSTPADATGADIWDGTSIDTKWYDQESNSYTISTASELAGLAHLVNDGNSFNGITITLKTNIDLGGKDWIPIGTGASKFMGSFVGTDFKISNLYIVDDTLECAGLFGVLASPGSITGVTIENAEVNAKSSVGALIGSAYTGTISECKVTGEISITGYYKVGGLIGEGYATIENCSVSGSSGSSVTGKYLEANLEGDNVGGLIGFRGEGTNQITGCSVSGITVDGTRKVGGLVGSAFDNNTIIGCSVTDVTVNSSATPGYIQDNLSSIAIGGLIGLYTHNGDGNGVWRTAL